MFFFFFFTVFKFSNLNTLYSVFWSHCLASNFFGGEEGESYLLSQILHGTKIRTLWSLQNIDFVVLKVLRIFIPFFFCPKCNFSYNRSVLWSPFLPPAKTRTHSMTAPPPYFTVGIGMRPSGLQASPFFPLNVFCCISQTLQLYFHPTTGWTIWSLWL